MHLIIIIAIIVVVVGGGASLVLNEKKYPICPGCRTNEVTRRKIFSKTAHCSKHGDFIPR